MRKKVLDSRRIFASFRWLIGNLPYFKCHFYIASANSEPVIPGYLYSRMWAWSSSYGSVGTATLCDRFDFSLFLLLSFGLRENRKSSENLRCFDVPFFWGCSRASSSVVSVVDSRLPVISPCQLTVELSLSVLTSSLIYLMYFLLAHRDVGHDDPLNRDCAATPKMPMLTPFRYKQIRIQPKTFIESFGILFIKLMN